MFCSSNQVYNDVGQSDCGDTYMSISSMDTCALSGMSEYQQGLLGSTPSYCNQTTDYAPVQGMYSATDVPAIARLQFHPYIPQLVDNRYLAPIMNVDGSVVAPIQGAPNATIDQYMQQAAQASANAAATVTQNADKIIQTPEGFFILGNVSGVPATRKAKIATGSTSGIMTNKDIQQALAKQAAAKNLSAAAKFSSSVASSRMR